MTFQEQKREMGYISHSLWLFMFEKRPRIKRRFYSDILQTASARDTATKIRRLPNLHVIFLDGHFPEENEYLLLDLVTFWQL